jgi:hypothetical protein
VREPSAALIVGSFALLAAAVVAGTGAAVVAPLCLSVVVLAGFHKNLLRWPSLVGLIVLVVLFVPFKRYNLPANLPFNLELYRLVVAVVVLAWLSSLLIDSRVRLRRTAFDWPVLLILAWVFYSDAANPGRVDATSSFVAKALTFFVSFVFVYFMITSVIRRRESAVMLLRILALGLTLIAVAALIERRTGYNVFNHLHSVLPFLRFEGAGEVTRFGRLRVLGPAQHPIALGATLAVGVPLTVYFARVEGRRWMIATFLLLLGAMGTGSRTAVVMLITAAVVFLALKPRETKRFWPALLPALLLTHFLVPGAIGSLRNAFFPPGGIIAQQSLLPAGENPNLAGGRLRQFSPMLREAAHHPIFGEGYGTRITGFDSTAVDNAPILDDQWLNTVLELGYVGLALWMWLFVRAVRRLVRAARTSASDDDSWLYTSLAAAVSSLAIGMFTFDLFGFIQIMFILWIVLALSAVTLAWRGEPAVTLHA